MRALTANPFSWFFFIAILILLNTIGWYYRFSLFGDAVNHKSSTIFGALGDIGGIVAFRIFEYVLIFAFFMYLWRYGNKM